MLAFFKMYVNARCSPSRVFLGGVQMFGMGSSILMAVKKNSTGNVSSRSYAEALVGPRPVPSSAIHKGNYGISDVSGMRGSDVRDRSAPVAFSWNPLNHAGAVSTKVLECDMGVNLDFCALKRLTALLKKELECFLLYPLSHYVFLLYTSCVHLSVPFCVLMKFIYLLKKNSSY